MTRAGPAPRWLGPPATAVPAPEKIPAPMIAPMPSAVSCQAVSERRRPGSTMAWGSSPTSARATAIGLRRKSCLMRARQRGAVGSLVFGFRVRWLERHLVGDGEACPTQHAVRAAVGEVYDQPDHHPDDEPHPGVGGETHHHVAADPDAENRNERNERCPERPWPIGLLDPQVPHAGTDDDEREQGADRDQLAEKPDREQAGD